MANEFIARKGIISLDSIQVTGSITATGGITISGSISSASFATTAATASSADNFFVRQNLTASSALFTGSITAQTLVVQTVTSSITYSSGSNIFGNQLTNIQQFTGSLRVTGSGNHFILGGNVGIGNSSPVKSLEVVGDYRQKALVGNSDGFSMSINSATDVVSLTNYYNAAITLGTSNTTRLTIAGTGGATFTCNVLASYYAADNGGTGGAAQLLYRLAASSGANFGQIGNTGTRWSLGYGSSATALGTEVLVWNSSCNVGIGTTSPSGKLDVSQDQNSTSTGTFTSPHIRLSATNTTDTTGFTGVAYSTSTLTNYGFTAGAQRTGTLGSDAAFIWRYHNNSATGTEYMRITSGGNINIGNSSTTGKQLIVNQGGTTGYFLSGEVSCTELAYWYYNASEIQFSSKSSTRALSLMTCDTERMRITSAGLVGINKTNPEVWLHIEDCNARTSIDAYTFPLHIENRCNQGAQSGYTGIRFKNIYNGTANYGYIVQEAIGSSFDYAPRIYIGGYTGGAYTNRMSVDICTGAVGIKATNISSEANLFLGAQGTVEGGQLVLQKGTSCSCATHLDNYNDAFRIMSGTDTASNTVHFLVDYKQSMVGIGRTVPFTTFGDSTGITQYGAGTIYASAAGNEALGLARRTNDGAVALFRRDTTTVGSICVTTTATSFNTSSDYRLKTDLKSFNGVCLIARIKPYDFKWKINCDRMYGFIAHELAEVLPYVVSGEKDGEEMQSLDYSKLTPVLVKAIQEQQCQICTQSTIIDQLKICLGII